MHLLVLNQKLDSTDSGLEVAWEWVCELAARVSKVTVITHEKGAGPLPANVRVLSLGRERQFGRLRKVREFYRALFGVLRESRVDACFVHMVPLFAVMAAPVLRMRGIPIVQWYTHGTVTLTLRAAVLVVDRVATASPESLALHSRKIVVTGHGINTARFRPCPRQQNADFHVVTVGRLSPSKRHDRLIDAIALLRDHPRRIYLSIIGEPRGPNAATWMDQLRQQVQRHGIDELVSFMGPVTRERVVSWYHSADVCVNLSETNSIDKAVLEAMSCGVPVVTSNPAFRSLLNDVAPHLVIPDSRPDTVATAIKAVMGLDGEALASLRDLLRAKVIEQHNLQILIDRLITLFDEPHTSS